MVLKMKDVMPLQSVYPKLKSATLSIKTLYKLSKLYNAVAKESEFYSERLNALATEYAEKDEKGNPKITEDGTGIEIKKDLIDEVNGKFDELYNLDVNMPDIKFTLDELEGADITLEDMRVLEPFIEEIV